MKNRFTKITSILAASMLLTSTVSAQVSTASSTDKIIYSDTQEMNAISIDIRDNLDYSSVEAEKLTLDFNISTDSDGYTYIDFIVDGPTEIEDLELPISFYDDVPNYFCDPVNVEVLDGYDFQKGVPSGKIIDDEGYPFYTYQLVRFNSEKHTVSGTILSLKFAYAPMYVWYDAPQVPVMSYWMLSEENGYYRTTSERCAYTEMPEVNISYIKEQEKSINDMHSKIDVLQEQLDMMQLPEFRYDFNCDGDVTIADAVLLMRYINEH